jgi:hypothetical protein
MTNVYCRPMNKDIVISYYGKPRKKVWLNEWIWNKDF